MVDGGEKRDDLAAEVNVNSRTLTKWFRLLDLAPHRTRPTGGAGRLPVIHISAAQLDAAIAAHDAGQTWAVVAAGLGISDKTLRKKLKARADLP